VSGDYLSVRRLVNMRWLWSWGQCASTQGPFDAEQLPRHACFTAPTCLLLKFASPLNGTHLVTVECLRHAHDGFIDLDPNPKVSTATPRLHTELHTLMIKCPMMSTPGRLVGCARGTQMYPNVPAFYCVWCVCVPMHQNARLQSKVDMELAMGFLIAAMVLSALLSLFMWVPCYQVIDERVMHSVHLAKAGHGKGASVFDRADCQNPVRGGCKVRVLWRGLLLLGFSL
jgi:hypothetical protein